MINWHGELVPTANKKWDATVRGEKKREPNKPSHTNATLLLVFNVALPAPLLDRSEKKVGAIGAIENGDGRCVCVACFDGKLQRFPFFFTMDGLHKTPQFGMEIGTVVMVS